MAQYIFKRYEKKYLLNTEQYNDALNMLSLNTVSDKYGESDICNLYFDTLISELYGNLLKNLFIKKNCGFDVTENQVTRVPAF